MFLLEPSMRRLITFLLALATLVTAVIAAYYWFRSAIVPTAEMSEPVASVTDDPVQHLDVAIANANYIRRSLTESGRLNKHAAIWTGVSAIIGAVATFFGLLP